MFYSLTGTYEYFETGFAVINCGGVGFKCLTTLNTLRALGEIGEAVTLYTHLNVREDALDLFGFATQDELSCFKKILGVSGVGPKMALAILSEMSPQSLASVVASGNTHMLTKVSGVGSKTAQRIILELKDKLSFQSADGTAVKGPAASAVIDISAVEDAVTALTALGFSKNEASSAAAKCADGADNVEEIIRRSLKLLSK